MLREQMHYGIRLELCDCFYACLVVIPSVLCVFSQAPQEKCRLRPATGRILLRLPTDQSPLEK